MTTATIAPAFTGFRPEAIRFLADLTANNDRAWFQPRKAEYERLLKEPLEALCAALAERFAARGIPLRADPARSPFRIYRDVRFSRDKSPYKTNLGAGFPWVEGRAGPGGGRYAERDGGSGVGGYFHLQPGEIYVGGGMWHPERTRLTAWRAAVDRDPASVTALLGDPAFVDSFGSVSGDRLARVPTGYPPDHPAAELLKLKDVVFGRRLSDEDAFSPTLPDLVSDSLAAGVPLMRFLAQLPT